MKTVSRRKDDLDAISIREMEIRDLPEVYALGEQLFTAEKWPTMYRAWDEYEVVELFASDGEFCLVAETAEHKVVGFALGTLMEKDRSAWTYGWLQWLGISTQYQGRGIGRRLLKRLTELFIEEDARMMLVDTDAQNDVALDFYRTQGFGNEMQHIYLSKNFSEEPRYIQHRAAKKRRAAARRRKRMLGSGLARGKSRVK